MSEQVTIVVVPRDRFSSVVESVKCILQNTEVPFKLAILDLGYSKSAIGKIKELCQNIPLEVVSVGHEIPMVAFKHYLPNISTPYVAWVDNDTFVSKGWMTALLNRAAQGARVILPVTLEREGVDTDPRGITLRNHISHSELRKVTVEGIEYVFDHKPFRRAAPEEIPSEPHTIDFFELHAFFAETEVLRQLDLPPMVVREHIDIGIQLHRAGIDIWCEPKSIVHFDNIHERPTRKDLGFFFFRWNERLINESHDLFHKRWGYRFYNEQFMKNWAYRRKIFSICRFLGLPSKPSDFLSKGFNKLFRPPLPKALSKDPMSQSERALEVRTAAVPQV